MVDRGKLMKLGGVETGLSLVVYLVMTWYQYQRELDGAWQPSYWSNLSYGVTYGARMLFVAGIVMVVVAFAMQQPTSDDSIFRP